MLRISLLALVFVVPFTLPLLLASAATGDQRTGSSAPPDASFDAGFRTMPPRDAAAYAHVDWRHVSPQKYEASLTGYVARVRVGNQRALNETAVVWAHYLNALHNQIHPAFTDSFLTGLVGQDAGDALDDPHLITRLEIVLDAQGRVSTLGVVRSSGQVRFDLAALEAVTRSGPYPQPPPELRSFDGNVYLHWEFHRNPTFACSTMNARPFRLMLDPTDAAARD
jgi:TonB family protein